MKKISNAWIAALIILLVSATTVSAQSKLEKILGDKTLPNLTLTDMNGKQVNVADLGKNGKINIISFWATWCVPCKKELNNMNELLDEWKKKYDVNLLAVSIDDSRSSTKVKPYADSQRWGFNVLLDVNQDLKRELNIQSVPFTVIVNQAGKIVATHSGYTEGDENLLEDQIQALHNKQ